MKSFMQVVHEDTEYMSTVNEGWGRAFMLIVPILLGIASIPYTGPGNIGLGIGNAVSFSVMKLTTNSVKKIFNNSKVQKYLMTQEHIIFKKLKNKNKHLIEAIGSGKWYRDGYNSKDELKAIGSPTNLKYGHIKIGKNFIIEYDYNHINRVWCIFKDTQTNEYIAKQISCPNKKDLGIYED